MISENEIPEVIESTLPELSAICKQDKVETPYRIAREMIRFTRNQLVANNIAGVKSCLNLAEKLYSKGNFAVRNAIETVFVYSLTHTFLHGIEGGKLKKMLPAKLHELYNRQVLYSHL